MELCAVRVASSASEKVLGLLGVVGPLVDHFCTEHSLCNILPGLRSPFSYQHQTATLVDKHFGFSGQASDSPREEWCSSPTLSRSWMAE